MLFMPNISRLNMKTAIDLPAAVPSSDTETAGNDNVIARHLNANRIYIT